MDQAQLNAITDIDVLRALVADKIIEIGARDDLLAKRDELLAKRDRELVYKAAKIDQLTREIARLRRVQFAARSEKLDSEQTFAADEDLVGSRLAGSGGLGAIGDGGILASSYCQPDEQREHHDRGYLLRGQAETGERSCQDEPAPATIVLPANDALK